MPGARGSQVGRQPQHCLCTAVCLDHRGFPDSSAGKESACKAGDLGLIPGLGRSPGEGNSYPLQYSGLENSMDYIVRGVKKSGTCPNHFPFHFLSLDHRRWSGHPASAMLWPLDCRAGRGGGGQLRGTARLWKREGGRAPASQIENLGSDQIRLGPHEQLRWVGAATTGMEGPLGRWA